MGSPFLLKRYIHVIYKSFFRIMKKFLLFVAAFTALSLTSCGGSETSSVPDGNSQATSVDPNDPNQAPPQMEASSIVEENTSTATEQTTPEGQVSTTEQSNATNN